MTDGSLQLPGLNTSPGSQGLPSPSFSAAPGPALKAAARHGAQGQLAGRLVNAKSIVSAPASPGETQNAHHEQSFQFQQTRGRRTGRYKMRRALGNLLGPESNISKCGSRSIAAVNGDVDGGIEMRTNDGSAYYSGVLHCGSVWMCPICAPKILARRGREIDEIVSAAQERGATILFVTLTVRHHAWDKAKDLVPIISGAYGKLLSGRAWYGHSGKERQKRLSEGKSVSDGLRGGLGYVGMTRAMELSYGDNGHHPHSHSILIFDKPLTDAEIEKFTDHIEPKWAKHVKTTTGETVRKGVGVDVRRWNTNDDVAGWYVTKVGQGWTLGSELTAGMYKDAYGKSKNPAQLAKQYVNSLTSEQGPDEKIGQILKEIWAATKGKNLTYTSPKLREWAGLNEEKTDEELANEDVDGTPIAVIDERLYEQAHKLNAHPDLLTATETNGLAGLAEAFEDYGLPVTISQPITGDGPPTISLSAKWWTAHRNN